MKARKSEKEELIPGGNTISLHTEIQTVPDQDETNNSKIQAIYSQEKGTPPRCKTSHNRDLNGRRATQARVTPKGKTI